MPYALKPKCSWPGCNKQRKPGGSLCAGHATQAEQLRGTTAQRGYGQGHRRLREQWAPLVATGRVTCWRCGQAIAPDAAWDLGHDDVDRTITRGPEHAGQCNRAAAARKGNARR